MSTSLREVKEVNGWKINHPHSGANIFYAILVLLLAASPVAYLFLNIASLEGVGQFNGIDLATMVVNFVKYLTKASADKMDPASFMYTLSLEANTGMISSAVPTLYLVSAGLFLIIGIFSIVSLILFIVLIVKGYLKGSVAIKIFAIFDFIFSLLFALTYLVIYFGYRTSSTGTSAGAPELNIWNNFYITCGYLILLVTISIVYDNNFKNSIPENRLEMHDDTPTVEHISQVHEVTKVNYEQSSTLPPDLTAIGGSQFAENQSLKVANIPVEVTKLGSSAFANCLNLKVVSIPNTVTEIGYNCFFNCCKLERINYGGTKAEWKKVIRGSNWLLKAGTDEVVCIDGTIVVSPFH